MRKTSLVCGAIFVFAAYGVFTQHSDYVRNGENKFINEAANARWQSDVGKRARREAIADTEEVQRCLEIRSQVYCNEDLSVAQRIRFHADIERALGSPIYSDYGFGATNRQKRNGYLLLAILSGAAFLYSIRRKPAVNGSATPT